MRQYLNLLKHVLDNGVNATDRTGTGTLSVFGTQQRYNLSDSFPLVTTKYVNIKAIIAELLWFLEGSTDERRLAEIYYQDKRENLIGKNTIWTANAVQQGKDLGYENNDLVKELGPVYSHQWRSWTGKDGETFDQIKQVIESIKSDPFGRRHIVNAWNVGEIDMMALPPCHVLFQFYVRKGRLSCQLYQRSADFFLGCPFNIASYALLTMMVAQVCDLLPGEFIHTCGDAHIYNNHIDQVKEQLTRTPYPEPLMVLDPFVTDIDDFNMGSFNLVDYQHHPIIKAKMAV